MSDENKDLNSDQVVTDPKDLNSAGSVDQQDLNIDPVNQVQSDGTLADGTSADKTVKYSELQKATKRATDAEEGRLHAERTIELMQAQQQGQQMAQQQVQAKSTFEQAMLDCGVNEDELFGEAQVRVMNRKSQLDGAMVQQQNATTSANQFMMSHPDFNQVVGSVNLATGQMQESQELSALLVKKPYLRAACTSVEVVYDLVMQERKLKEFESVQTSNQEHQNRQNADNITQPMGGSAAGGGGGSVQGSQVMSREQQLDIRRRLAAGEIIS
jgi:hypothetical protein